MEGRKKGFAVLLLVILFLGCFSLVSAVSPAKLLSGFLSNALSVMLKKLWSITSAPKTAVVGRPLMKFETGYLVETVFDGSKLGIEPYSVEMLSSGELLVLDSVNSNIYVMSLPLSRYSRPKLVAGSADGYAGHIDGKPREARMNHPKGFTVDDRGNIYVADVMNMAIRKISDAGITTIAGGKWNRGGHMDGPSEDAKFSNDFEVVYIGSSCSLLVVDRGNQAIREIQLHFDDCAYQYETSFPLGMAVLFAAGFFGYMLALLQRRVGVMFSAQDDSATDLNASIPGPAYQNPIRGSVRPPLIPTESDSKQQDEEEGFFATTTKLLSGTKLTLAEIFGALFRRKTRAKQQQVASQQQQRLNPWPVQESFVIPDEDEPPPVETKTPTPRKTYAFMSKGQAKIHHLRQGQDNISGWDGKMQQQPSLQQQVHQLRQYSSGPKTYYEHSCEATNEIVFGAVQEVDSSRKTVEIRAVNYGDTFYDRYGLRSRIVFNG
ncbi:hypothetical protein HPP92_018660 [Vanilla planifolia]|uniref:NHL repeat-containing protein n=1 Tax=Vanilla planifolia TaxID=51239 RepID=A0A835QF81_VANPL|nr:hypothetical protein HPP92_019253 [Vanilla planifolia]KAG0469332.1 hypothetical protein HPP92_018660 [Vanilla planifolia]